MERDCTNRRNLNLRHYWIQRNNMSQEYIATENIYKKDEQSNMNSFAFCSLTERSSYGP